MRIVYQEGKAYFHDAPGESVISALLRDGSGTHYAVIKRTDVDPRKEDSPVYEIWLGVERLRKADFVNVHPRSDGETLKAYFVIDGKQGNLFAPGVMSTSDHLRKGPRISYDRRSQRAQSISLEHLAKSSTPFSRMPNVIAPDIFTDDNDTPRKAS